MVFVTVGNATQGFARLLSAVERLAESGSFADEEVVVQSGSTPDFRSRVCTQVEFVSGQEFAALIARADVIVSHGGAGTLMHILRAGKVPVVMPRRRHHREVLDDHQLELAGALASVGRIIPAYEADDLAGAIAEARKRCGEGAPAELSALVGAVARVVDELLESRRGRDRA